LHRSLIAALLLFIVPLSAYAQETTPAADIRLCPSAASATATPDPASNPKKVLTTFSILADMARHVACDKLVVESVTKVGAEIHGYEPTPSDVAKAQNADLVLYNGLNLERWFEKFMGNVRNVPSVLVSDGLELMPIAEGNYKDKPNPHAWMSPKNALIYVENMRKAFVALDPANEAAYSANAQAYGEAIKQVDTFLSEQLSQVPAEARFLVSCEGAFSYLIRDYDLKELYMWPINADQTGTPKQMAKVIDGVRKNNIPVVFCESTVNNDPQKEVARQTGARFGGYLYVDSVTAPDGEAPTYLDLLRFDAERIVNGLLGKAENS
jgi:ABC-type Zn uptake system ZnuABC Zn-binding protein ZnuA